MARGALTAGVKRLRRPGVGWDRPIAFSQFGVQQAVQCGECSGFISKMLVQSSALCAHAAKATFQDNAAKQIFAQVQAIKARHIFRWVRSMEQMGF